MKQPMLILIVVWLFSCGSVYGKEIQVVTDTWHNYSNSDGSGYYLDILKEIYPSPKYTLKVRYVPYRRALYLVETGKADITVGVYKGDLAGKYIGKYFVLNDKVDVVVSNEIARNWQSLTSLKDKRIVSKIGYSLNNYINFPIIYRERSSLLNMMRMLQAGRTDAVLDFAVDITQLWQEAGLEDDFKIIENVIRIDAYFAFSIEQQDLKHRFEQVFPELVQSGKVEKIRLKYGSDINRLLGFD